MSIISNKSKKILLYKDYYSSINVSKRKKFFRNSTFQKIKLFSFFYVPFHLSYKNIYFMLFVIMAWLLSLPNYHNFPMHPGFIVTILMFAKDFRVFVPEGSTALMQKFHWVFLYEIINFSLFPNCVFQGDIPLRPFPRSSLAREAYCLSKFKSL